MGLGAVRLKLMMDGGDDFIPVDARAVEPLIQALKDGEEFVREAAEEALEKIRAKKS